jgi:glycosyltransferase involved in cell wall biosynthesis
VGDIPAILADTGYLVPPSDPDAIAATLTQIFADWASAEHRGQTARERCVNYYSVEKMAGILAQVLNPLLA